MDLLRLGGGGLGLRTCLRRWVGVTRTEKEAEGITRTVKEVGGFAAVGGEVMEILVSESTAQCSGRSVSSISTTNPTTTIQLNSPKNGEFERVPKNKKERERNQRAFGAARGDGVAWLRWVLWGRGGQKRKKGKMEVRGADEEWKKGKGFCLNSFDLISFSTGLDLSGLFNDHSYGSVEDSERFVLEKTMEKVVERVEAFAKVEKLRVRRKKAWGLDME
ncbi:hypothetical protein GBA52_016967 [Prunus armeniaca]|nr:hypothetical protein GBA52_016967 [Prunus armeniaca]